MVSLLEKAEFSPFSVAKQSRFVFVNTPVLRRFWVIAASCNNLEKRWHERLHVVPQKDVEAGQMLFPLP